MDSVISRRLGIVVPPENPTAEPEFGALIGSSVDIYATRFPVTPGMALREMLETYNRVLPDTLATFGEMPLNAGIVACSASHYLLHPRGDRDICDEITERAGYPVASCTQTILAALQALGVSSLALVSPYQPWLTETSRAFWSEAGLTVTQIVSVPATPEGHYDPYRVTTDAILHRLREARLPSDTPLLFTGTGMGTIAAAMEIAAADEQRVIVSSNLASAWWALRTLEGDMGDRHPLIARLERQAVDRVDA